MPRPADFTRNTGSYTVAPRDTSSPSPPPGSSPYQPPASGGNSSAPVRRVARINSDVVSHVASSNMSTDDRTRHNAFSLRNQSTRKGSVGLPNAVGENSPARIFEHCRRDPAEVEDGEGHTTNVTFPTSIEEVERWLDGLIETAMATTSAQADQSSSVRILFLDEKKCAKYLKEEFPLTRLLPRLKIRDWCTSHYQTTFCRFPVPLDMEDYEDGDDRQHIWDWRFTISHPFDWDMLWIYLPTTRTSVGIVRTWFDGYDLNFTHLETAITSFPARTLANPLILGIFALEVLTTDAMSNVREKGNRIYEAQTTTGFHTYNRLRRTDSEDEELSRDLANITRKVIGAASHVTGWENATLQMAKFARFLQEENRRFIDTAAVPLRRPETRLATYVHQQADKLVGDIDGAYHDSVAWLSTANFLLQGVLNLLGQHDANTNIELAKDQKRIAEETKRDSTSMTGIAVVTMVFLPGTFTASFFALPYFEPLIEEHGMSEFWVYWAVTAPLTIIVLVAWTLWTKYMNPPVPREEDQKPENKQSNTANIVQEFLARARTRSVVGSGGTVKEETA